MTDPITSAVLAFNLLCTGVTTESSGLSKHKTPFTVELRVDLPNAKWCFGECKSQDAIHELRNDRIEFANEKSETLTTGYKSHLLTVNRETGEFYESQLIVLTGPVPLFGSNQTVVMSKGSCERKDFTGFPSITTKF